MNQYKDTLYIVMRVYFEKPRTTVGWKGLINDPHMDDSFDIETGLKQARELLLWISELGLPIATEALDPISPQYLGDLCSVGPLLARVLLSHKLTVKWQAVYRCRLVLKMVQTAVYLPQLTRCSRLLLHTVLWGSISQGQSALLQTSR